MKRLSGVLFAGTLLFLAVNCGPTAVPAPTLTPETPKPVVRTTDYVIPTPSITGPSSPVKRGKNIVIGVQPPSGPAPEGLVGVTYNWVISPKIEDLFAWPDNTRACFGSGIAGEPTNYTVTLFACYVFADSNGKYAATRTVQVEKSITIIDVEPPAPVPVPVPPAPVPVPVPPAPVPPPEPTKPVFNEKFGLSTFTYNQVAGLNKQEMTALAKSFRSVADQIGGDLKTKGDVVVALMHSNVAVLGNSLNSWKPTLDAIAKQLNATSLTNNDDYKQALGEIAAGLEAAAK